MSVTTRPSTESPRNSRRSFVCPRPRSNANERWVMAAWRSDGSVNETPRARSRDSSGVGGATALTPSLDFDRLTAGVVAAVAADDVGELGLMTLRALCVGGRLRLPVR